MQSYIDSIYSENINFVQSIERTPWYCHRNEATSPNLIYQLPPVPPLGAAVTSLAMQGFGCVIEGPSMPSSSPLWFLQLGFLRGYEQLEDVYCNGTAGFLTILRWSYTSAAEFRPEPYRKTDPTTFPGLAAAPDLETMSALRQMLKLHKRIIWKQNKNQLSIHLVLCEELEVEFLSHGWRNFYLVVTSQHP